MCWNSKWKKGQALEAMLEGPFGGPDGLSPMGSPYSPRFLPLPAPPLLLPRPLTSCLGSTPTSWSSWSPATGTTLIKGAWWNSALEFMVQFLEIALYPKNFCPDFFGGSALKTLLCHTYSEPSGRALLHGSMRFMPHNMAVWYCDERLLVVVGKVDSRYRQIVADWFSNNQRDLSLKKGHVCNSKSCPPVHYHSDFP